MHEIILALIRGIYLCPFIWISPLSGDTSQPLKTAELSLVIWLVGGVVQTFSAIHLQ